MTGVRDLVVLRSVALVEWKDKFFETIHKSIGLDRVLGPARRGAAFLPLEFARVHLREARAWRRGAGRRPSCLAIDRRFPLPFRFVPLERQTPETENARLPRTESLASARGDRSPRRPALTG